MKKKWTLLALVSTLAVSVFLFLYSRLSRELDKMEFLNLTT
jgi:hypothetical protein